MKRNSQSDVENELLHYSNKKNFKLGDAYDVGSSSDDENSIIECNSDSDSELFSFEKKKSKDNQETEEKSRKAPISKFIDDDELSPPPVIAPSEKRTAAHALITRMKTLTKFDESIDSINVDDDDEICPIKIRLHGIVTKYDIQQKGTLEDLYINIAKNENVARSQISLEFKGNAVKSTDTVDSLAITVADIIDCIIDDEEDEGDKYVIYIQTESSKKLGGTREEYKIGKDEKLENIFKLFCEKSRWDIEKVKFYFEGEALDSTDSPLSIGLEDEDILDAVLK